METRRWSLLQSLFNRYVDMAPDLRRSRLKAEQIDDDSLVDEVLAMCLRADRSASTLPGPDDLLTSLLQETPDPYLDRTLGLYRLEELVGRGGMGWVYKATRIDYGGLIAVKVLYQRLLTETSSEVYDTISQARRELFVEEQKTLAKLTHPAIARIMDAGAEPDGTLYFVMEFVDGKNLLEHCQQHALALRERLRLFKTACEAVQYAHQRGIVHRDLKPSNILVSAEGQLKLLDFGISQALPESNRFAGTPTQSFMTLAYAAPEQVQQAPSAREADVYALGVILHQLITVRLPFDFEDKTQREVRRVILEEEPSFPARLPTTGLASKTEWQDLKAICGKALRKDPGERYGSAEAMAADVEHFLQYRPLMCRKPHTWHHRIRKYWRRNQGRLVFAGSAALVLALVTLRLKASRDEALHEANRAREVQAFTMSIFKGFDPAMERVSKDSAEPVLNRGEKEARLLRNQPLVQADVFAVLGSGFENLGTMNRAEILFREALTLRQRVYGVGSYQTVGDLLSLGDLMEDMSQFDKSERYDRDALQTAQRQSPPSPALIAKAQLSLGNVLADVGKNSEALLLFKDALPTFRNNPPDLDGQEDAETGLAITNINLGNLEEGRQHNVEALRIARLLKGSNHPDVADKLITANELDTLAARRTEAEQEARQAWSIYQNWLGPEHPKTLKAERVVAQDLTALGRYAEAERILQSTLTSEEHVKPEPNKELALILNALAWSETELGKFEAAERHYVGAIDVYKALYRRDDYKIGITLHNLALLNIKRGKLSASEQEARQALANLRDNVGTNSPRTALTEGLLGRILAIEHKDKEAEIMMLASIEAMRRQVPPPVAEIDNVRYNLHLLYLREGETEKARAFEN